MSFRYFRVSDRVGGTLGLFRFPANGKDLIQQELDDVAVYEPNGTWRAGQRQTLWHEAVSGWFNEEDDEISVERAMQMMSDISAAHAASRQGQTPATEQAAIGENRKRGSTRQRAESAPGAKPRRLRRTITLGAVIFIGAWIIKIIATFGSHDNDRPIIHPLQSISMPAHSLGV